MKGSHLVPVVALVAGVMLSGCADNQTEQIVGAPEGAGAYSNAIQKNTAAAANGNAASAAGQGSQAAPQRAPQNGSNAGSEDAQVTPLAGDNVQSDKCDVSELKGYTGKPGNQQVFEEILQRSGASIQRVLSPQSITTMDYRAERVDIHVDGSGKITQLSCG
ncbi:I78 family peptidase inhibitor [Carnimonas bestiolae]|uniref:I78 family peptidase inhibitor n=1 Tax=Carnimonas bestiolae TaxID=3402172 RepID=UPI003EDBA442